MIKPLVQRHTASGLKYDKLVILAGNRRQFDEFLRTNDLTHHDCAYAGSADSIRQIRNFYYIKTGTWWLHPDAKDIQKYCDAHWGVAVF